MNVIANRPTGPSAPVPAVPSPGAPWRARHPAASFLLGRIAAGLGTLLVTSLLIFLATNALPGNVAEAVLGKHADPTTTQLLENRLGLDEPLLQRYLDWLEGLVHGDLGESAAVLSQGGADPSVASIIATPMLNSFLLALLVLALLIPLALLIGTISALRAGRPTDYALSYSSLVLASLPEFVLGTFLIQIFFAQLGLLPPLALVQPGESPLAHPDALVLPVLTLLGVSLAFSSRQVRAGVIEALRQNYVVVARLNGIRERRVVWRYALCNALATTIQTFAQTILYLFGGIVVVEALFNYPGIGRELVQAVSVRDVPEVQGIMLVLTALYIAVNIVADFLVVLLVPKLRTGMR